MKDNKDNKGKRLNVSLGMLLPDFCPEPLFDLHAGYIEDGIVFIEGSVPRFYWDKYKKLQRDRRAEKQEDEIIYFLEGGDYIKIGKTSVKRLEERVQTIRNMSPVPLGLLGTIEGGLEREREIHHKFKELRNHGEWFEAAGVLIEFIEGET